MRYWNLMKMLCESVEVSFLYLNVGLEGINEEALRRAWGADICVA